MGNAAGMFLPETVDKNCARTTLGDAYNDWQFDQLAVDGVITREHLKAAIRGEPIVSVTETTKIGVSSASSAAAAAAITSADTVGTASTGETNSTKKSTKKSGKQYSLLVCLSESSGPVCKCVADATAGMRFSKSHADCNKRNSVWFLAGGMELQRALDAALPGKQSPVLSKFPGAREACNKAVMSAQLNWAQYLFPETFDFWPISYNLPAQHAQLLAVMKRTPGSTYIVKPPGAAQGDGIFLVQQAKHLRYSSDPGNPFVAQKYITNPMLLDGYKFDLRIYVLVTSLVPLRVSLCREGLVRLATIPYTKPTSKNLTKVTMHLTNYSLNKRSKDFDHGSEDDFGVGSKRTLTAAFAELEKGGVDVEECWEQIRLLARATVVALSPVLLSACSRESRSREKNKDSKMVDLTRGKCFQIMGFDVLLDRSGHAHLLEVNANPSMSIDSVHELPDDASVPSSASSGSNYKSRREGGVCRCMDSHRPHTHAVSPVDKAIKTVVLQGALQLLNGQSCKNYMDVGASYSDEMTKLMEALVAAHEVALGRKEKISAFTWRKLAAKLRPKADSSAADALFRKCQIEQHEEASTDTPELMFFITLLTRWMGTDLPGPALLARLEKTLGL